MQNIVKTLATQQAQVAALAGDFACTGIRTCTQNKSTRFKIKTPLILPFTLTSGSLWGPDMALRPYFAKNWPKVSKKVCEKTSRDFRLVMILQWILQIPGRKWESPQNSFFVQWNFFSHTSLLGNNPSTSELHKGVCSCPKAMEQWGQFLHFCSRHCEINKCYVIFNCEYATYRKCLHYNNYLKQSAVFFRRKQNCWNFRITWIGRILFGIIWLQGLHEARGPFPSPNFCIMFLCDTFCVRYYLMFLCCSLQASLQRVKCSDVV